MKKRIISLLISFTLTTLLIACSNAEATTTTQVAQAEEVTTTENVTQDESEEVTEETADTEEVTEEVTEVTEEAVEEVAEEPAEELKEEVAEEPKEELAEVEPIEEENEQLIKTELMTELDDILFAQSAVNVRFETTAEPTEGMKGVLTSLATNTQLAQAGIVNKEDSLDSKEWVAIYALNSNGKYQVASEVTFKDAEAKPSEEKVENVSRQIESVTVNGKEIKASDLKEGENIEVIYARANFFGTSKVSNTAKKPSGGNGGGSQQQQAAPAPTSGSDGITGGYYSSYAEAAAAEGLKLGGIPGGYTTANPEYHVEFH